MSAVGLDVVRRVRRRVGEYITVEWFRWSQNGTENATEPPSCGFDFRRPDPQMMSRPSVRIRKRLSSRALLQLTGDGLDSYAETMLNSRGHARKVPSVLVNGPRRVLDNSGGEQFGCTTSLEPSIFKSSRTTRTLIRLMPFPPSESSRELFCVHVKGLLVSSHVDAEIVHF